MSSLFDSLSEELFQTLKGSGKTLTLYTAAGNKTYEPKSARRVFAEPDKMMISVNELGSDSEVKLYLSQNVDLSKVSKLINTLRQISTRYNVLFNVRKFGRELKPKDFAFQTEPVTEAAMYGSTKTSYQKIGETKLIVRHCVPVREGVIGSRGRNILNMFVETKEGERFKFPVIHLSAARAFAQHLNQGGKPHDELGSSIVELAQESSDLAKVNRYIHHSRNILDENAIELRPFIKLRINELRSTFISLARPRGYSRIVEAGLPSSMALLCESQNGLETELARLQETLKIDSNHALAKSLTPVALLTLGVNMTKNINEMFHGLITVESADALLEVLADEYGYSDDSWLQMGNKIGFTDSAVFEAAQEYLNLVEGVYSLDETEDQILTYATNWFNVRNKNSGADDLMPREQTQAAEELADGLRDVLTPGKAVAKASYPPREVRFSNEAEQYAFELGLYLEPKAGLLNHSLAAYISSLVDKLESNKKLSQTERLIAGALIDKVDDSNSRTINPTTEEGVVDESYYNDDPYSGDNEPKIERCLQYYEDEFDGNDFLNTFDPQFVDTTMSDEDKNDPTPIDYFVDGIAHDIVDEFENEGLTGYTGSETFIKNVALELFDKEVRPILLNLGWTLVDPVAEFATEDSERMPPHNIQIGDFVATDLGSGKIEEINGDIAVVMFQNGQTKSMHVDDMDKVTESANGPEERELEEWFEGFDISNILAPLEEKESRPFDKGTKIRHSVYGSGIVLSQDKRLVKVAFLKPHKNLPDKRVVTVDSGTLQRANSIKKMTELSHDTRNNYFTAAAMDRGAAEKAEIENGDESAAKRKERRDRGLAHLLSKSMAEDSALDEKAGDNYYSIFVKNDDSSWSHYFDADSKADANEEARSLRNIGDKVLVLAVPKETANWGKGEGQTDPNEYVKSHLASKQTETVAEDSDESMDSTYIKNMPEDPEALLHAIAYKCGWSVEGQYRDIIDGEELEEQNINALRKIAEIAMDKGEFDFANDIKEYLKMNGVEETVESVESGIDESDTDDLKSMTATQLMAAYKEAYAKRGSREMQTYMANIKHELQSRSKRPMDESYGDEITYENTPENAAKIGWNKVPEYCVGDPSSPYVMHDHKTGTFHFTNEPGNSNEQTGDMSKDFINDVTEVDESAEAELANLLKNALYRK